MKAEFRHISPHELRNVWPTIRPGLEATAAHSPSGWLPEDVYMSIKTGASVLHIALVNNRYRGFVVTQTQDTSTGRKLLIWIAHGDGSGDVMADSIEQIREWAQNIGANKLRFETARKGWEKVAPKLGFEPVLTVYESDV